MTRSSSLRFKLAAAALALAALGSCATSGDPQPDASNDAGPDVHAVDAARADSARDLEPDAPALDGGATPPRSIKLPDDEAPHGDPVEWWYYTGVLDAADGQRYGFEMVTFQALLVGVPAYIAHFAVTDLGRQQYHHATRVAGGAQQQPAAGGFALKIDDWQMGGHAGDDRLVASLDASAAAPAGPTYAIDLSLSAEKPATLQYGTGWMTIGSPNPFYYYSYTRMSLTGTLEVDGKPLTVTGQAWMDHQWGELGREYRGWDWFSLRLDDQTEVMLFLVNRPDSPFVGGTFVASDGSYSELKASDFTVTSTGKWTSPHTGATYPHGWTVSIPSRDLEVTVAPLLADQEFYEVSYEPVYWEGLCEVSGSRGQLPVGGHGYVELTGYTP